jgi:hypothetical protein
MAIAAIIAAAQAEAAAAALLAAKTAAAATAATTTAAAAPTVAASLPGIINTAGSMTGSGAGLAATATPEALAMQSLTAPASMPGIMGGQGAMAPVEGIMQGAQAAAPVAESAGITQAAAPVAESAGLDAAKQQLISANPASNLSYPMPDTMPPMANPFGNFSTSANAPPKVDFTNYPKPDQFKGPSGAKPFSPEAGSLQNMNEMERNALQGGYNRPEITPQGGSAEAGAGSMKTGLEAGFEKALSFAKDNPMTTISGLQLLDRAFAPGQPKKRAFNPGYSLSPNFQPTLAPSAPSGPYGRNMAEGGIASDMEQPDYQPNVARYAQGGIASYATGGTTPTASNFMAEPIGVLTALLGREPTTKEVQAGLTAVKAGQPITTETVTGKPATAATTNTAAATTSKPSAAQALELLKAGDKTAAEAMLKASAATAAAPATTYAGGISPAALAASNTATSNPVVTNTNTNTTGGGATTTGTAPMTVADLYTTYFNRPADASGLASWTAQFGNEVDAAELQTFLNAQSTKDEIAGLGGTTKPVTNTTNTDTTTPRDPNVNPLSTSTAGTSGTYAHDMQGNIYNTATGVRVTQEEAERAAQPAFDINALYRKYLERNADESGIKTYDPSKYTAQQVSDYLMGSEEYKKQTLDPDEIQNAYRRVLQRNVDPSGASGYLGQNYSAGAFEDFLKKSKEYKEEVPFRTMERTIYKPEYEDYTKNPITSVPGMAIPDKLSYAAIQNQLGGTPTYNDVVRSSAVFEANKPTTPDQYMAMAKKGETGMAKGGKTSETNLYRALSASGDEVTKADMDAITAYHQHAGQLAEDDDVDTRLLDPYSAAQMRLAKLSKKNKMAMAPVAKTNVDPANMAQGGITQNLGGYSDGGHLLKGPGDGMSDHIPAMIGKRQPARLADGEFVIPADVVSHLGNGSTEAGAKQLYAMMSRIRKARTGNPKQGKQVNPRKLMPK